MARVSPYSLLKFVKLGGDVFGGRQRELEEILERFAGPWRLRVRKRDAVVEDRAEVFDRDRRRVSCRRAENCYAKDSE